ncbi:hypothetical protein JTP67_34110, partial [Streptomyces sp. S12]|nr:hypothetical protein [Streptomyces sp. S12]
MNTARPNCGIGRNTVSSRTIASALQRTFAHYDPQGDDIASHDAVLVGHSMGGVIGRLLLADSGERVIDASLAGLPADAARRL